MIRALLTHLRREDGVALLTVMGSLIIVGLLTVSTMAVALDGNQTSAKDRDGKRAAAAAQAALDLGYLRLTTVRPKAGECVFDSSAEPPLDAGGECREFAIQADDAAGLGNGARMSYVVGTEGAVGCRELAGDTRPPEIKQRDRCITATGVVNQVQRRAQMRVFYDPPFQPFKVAGLVARNAIVIRNDDTIVRSSIGANGSVTLSNGVRVNGQIQVAPACGPTLQVVCEAPGRPQAGWSYSTGASNVAGDPVVAAKRFEFKAFDQAFADAWSRTEPPAIRNADMGSYYNASTRSFSMGNNPPPLTLNGGIYVVCNFTTNQGANIKVASGQVAQIYVDSPRREGSQCPAGSGRFSLGQSSKVNLEVGANPAQLELYVYGTGNPLTTPQVDNLDAPDINMGNATTFYGSVYAPDASLSVDNGAYFTGAATVKNAEVLNNADFHFDPRVSETVVPGTGILDRKSWSECSPRRSVPTDPESGC